MESWKEGEFPQNLHLTEIPPGRAEKYQRGSITFVFERLFPEWVLIYFS